MQKLILPLIFGLSVITIGCSKQSVQQESQMPLESISATATNIDLSQRHNWILSVGYQKYSISISGNNFTALPLNEPFMAKYPAGDLNTPTTYYFSIFPPNYYKTQATLVRSTFATSPVDVFPLPINVEDQSTRKKCYMQMC